MPNVVTQSPFEELASFSPFHSPVDDLLRGFFVRPMSLASQSWGSYGIRVDVAENEKGYLLRADLPGATKEAINVSIYGSDVTISTEIKDEQQPSGDTRMLCSERWQGKVQRTFSLEHEIDEAKAQARYVNGVLELVLPKKETEMRKRVAVH